MWVQKNPPWGFLTFFPKRLGIFSPNFGKHTAHCTFISMLDYNFWSHYMQFWPSYAILSVTTHFAPYVQNVHHRLKRTLAFSDIFRKQLGIFGPNFTHLLYVPIYARLQNFIKFPPTVMKLCHIKCDHPACISTDGGHFEHIMVVGGCA